MSKVLNVIATREGYFGGRIRKPGDPFRLESEAQFSSRWMAAEGTKQHDDFVRAHKAGGGKVADRDKITGERITAGGVAEQLAVALEENARLEAEKKKLVDELRSVKQALAAKPVASTNPPKGKGSGQSEDTELEEAKARGEARRRRRLNQDKEE